MKYWLDLFSGRTWEEFLAAGGTTSGFRAGQATAAKKVKPGDRFICYVVGISRFIGVLEVIEHIGWDETPIWSSDVFPVRFKVQPVVSVPFEHAIPVIELHDRLDMLAALPRGSNVGHLFQGSLREIRKKDGDTILDALQKQTERPVAWPIDPKKLYKRTHYSLTKAHSKQGGEVTVPQKDELAPDEPVAAAPETTGHAEIQWTLLKLGALMGLDVWVAKNDKSREFNGQKFADAPRLLKTLPITFPDAVQKTIELIDVLWVDKKAIVGAFEIESTTSIYSGLLRMADLISEQPNVNIPLYIVAPDERRDKVIEEINRPTFANLQQPLSTACRYIAFSELKAAVTKHHAALPYVQPTFVWEELAESCELGDD
jgi:hypothetical protein